MFFNFMPDFALFLLDVSKSVEDVEDVEGKRKLLSYANGGRSSFHFSIFHMGTLYLPSTSSTSSTREEKIRDV